MGVCSHILATGRQVELITMRQNKGEAIAGTDPWVSSETRRLGRMRLHKTASSASTVKELHVNGTSY